MSSSNGTITITIKSAVLVSILTAVTSFGASRFIPHVGEDVLGLIAQRQVVTIERIAKLEVEVGNLRREVERLRDKQ